MNGILTHLVILPVILPLIVAALLLLFRDQHRAIKAAITFATMLALLAISLTLLVMTGNGASARLTSQNTSTFKSANATPPTQSNCTKSSHPSRTAREAFASMWSSAPPASGKIRGALGGSSSLAYQRGASRPALYVAGGER